MSMNMGNSMAIKECLHLHIDLLYKYQPKPDHGIVAHNYAQFLTLLASRLSTNAAYLKIADTEIIEEYLQQIYSFLREYPSNQELESELKVLFNTLDLAQVSSDNILIRIVELRTLLLLPLDKKDEEYLRELEKKTSNHFLQIAIFKYLQILNIDHELLLELVYKFSRPDQL
jgi:hypothetical protein